MGKKASGKKKQKTNSDPGLGGGLKKATHSHVGKQAS